MRTPYTTKSGLKIGVDAPHRKPCPTHEELHIQAVLLGYHRPPFWRSGWFWYSATVLVALTSALVLAT